MMVLPSIDYLMEAMKVKQKWKLLILCIAIPLAVGGLSALLTGGGMKDFEMLNKPPLSPPGWLFPVVWTILYTLMGLASYLVLTSGKDRREVRGALVWYGAQLAANFLWPILFFNLSWYLVALLWLLLLWVLVLVTTVKFSRISSRAGDLMLPYLLWLTFAAYLNYGIYRLN